MTVITHYYFLGVIIVYSLPIYWGYTILFCIHSGLIAWFWKCIKFHDCMCVVYKNKLTTHKCVKIDRQAGAELCQA